MKKIFPFMGQSIEISDSRDIYNSLRIKYEKKAFDAEKLFIQIYKNNNKSIDDVSNNADKQGYSVIGKFISETIEEIINMGFYNINEERFFKEYYDKYDVYYDYYYEPINEKYLDIVLTEEEKDEYRTRRRQNRPRWQGGGFGIGGALKGAAKAGALNMASGAIHGAFNLGGKVISSIGSSIKKSALFNNPNTLETLANGVANAVYNIHFAYIDFLNDNTGSHIQIIGKNESNEAEIIFNNITTKNIDNEVKINLLKKIIELNPYKTEIYKYIIDIFGDKDNEIENIATYYNIDILGYKEKIIHNIFEKLTFGNEQDTLNSKNILLNKLKQLGLNENDERVKIINNKLIEFDKQARLVDSILFETREEANEAKVKVDKIKNILECSNKNDKESMIYAKQQILELNLQKQIVDKYIDLIDNKIEELDLQERTYNGIIYETVKLKEEAMQKDILDSIFNNTDRNNEQSILSQLDKINNLNIDSDIKETYIMKLNEDLKQIDLKLRTLDGIVYNTRQECENAKINKQELESRTFNGKVYSSSYEANEARKKQIDTEQRTVNGILYETKELANKARKRIIKEDKRNERNKILSQNKFYQLVKRVVNIVIKINYYLILVLSLQISLDFISKGDIVSGLFVWLIPTIFIGLVIGAFKNIRIMKNKGVGIKILSIIIFTIVSWIISFIMV